MRCPTLQELPPPPPGKSGWPWTEETPQSPTSPPGGGAWQKISIVTPCFNHGEFVEETIRSVLLQGYQNLDYIIIDGASKDDSVGIIRRYERWLSYWVSEPDEGCSNAVKKGFTKATGEVFGIMCADDFYMPGGILKLVQLRLSQPNAVAWAGGCPEVDLAGKVVNPGGAFIRELAKMGDWGVGAWFGCIACLFDASSYVRVGGFDDRFKNANDVELWVKLSRLGSFSLSESIVATARFNPSSLSHRDWAGEVAALISLNYIHGCHANAKSILQRYVAKETGLEAKRFAPSDCLNRMSYRALLKGIAGRTASALRRRIRRVIGG